MRIKNILAALCVILCFTLLTGCAVQNPNENADSAKDVSSETEEDTENGTDESEPSELTYLRAKVKENGSAVGVAYAGYVPNAENVREYNYASDFSTNNIFKVYPFFYTYPVSVNVGAEMFAVIPSSTQSSIKVYKVNIGNDGTLSVDRDTVLYEDETGKPFILICNDHEAYSNVLIAVRDGDTTVEFSPRISIESDEGLVLGDGCCDVTVKDIRDYPTEVRKHLAENIDEIKAGIENGLSINYDTEVYIYNHYALKYVLGKNDENGKFVVVREYLVDEYYTMAFYEPEADEKTIGWRVVGIGFYYPRAKD